jgi:hypothetical protein
MTRGNRLVQGGIQHKLQVLLLHFFEICIKEKCINKGIKNNINFHQGSYSLKLTLPKNSFKILFSLISECTVWMVCGVKSAKLVTRAFVLLNLFGSGRSKQQCNLDSGGAE